MRSRTSLALLALPLLLFFAACQADLESGAPLSLHTRSALDVLPADAQAVAMVDVQAMKDNEFTSAFAPGRFSPEEMTGEAAARVLGFLAQTGLDPETDLHQIYAATSAIERGPSADAAVLIYGDYDRERITDYMDAELSAELTRGSYRDVPTYTSIDTDKAAYLAFPSDDLVIASGSSVALEAMLDRLAGEGTPALSSTTVLMPLAERAAGGTDAWVAVAEMPKGSDFDGGGEFDFGSTVQRFAAGMDAQSGGVEGRAFLVPAAGVSADDLASLVRGGVAAMRGSSDLPAEAVRVLDGIDIETADGLVRIVGFVDNATMQTMRNWD